MRLAAPPAARVCAARSLHFSPRMDGSASARNRTRCASGSLHDRSANALADPQRGRRYGAKSRLVDARLRAELSRLAQMPAPKCPRASWFRQLRVPDEHAPWPLREASAHGHKSCLDLAPPPLINPRDPASRASAPDADPLPSRLQWRTYLIGSRGDVGGGAGGGCPRPRGAPNAIGLKPREATASRTPTDPSHLARTDHCGWWCCSTRRR